MTAPILAPPVLAAGWLTGQGGVVGEMIIQPTVATPDGRLERLDAVLGSGFTLLGDGVDPKTLLDPEQQRAWDALGATYRTVREGGSRSESADDIIDIYAGLVGWMRARSVRVVALRPDRFVAACDATGLCAPR